MKYSKPRTFQSAFCVSCANREGDPIFAACSVCRLGKNGRPINYRPSGADVRELHGEHGIEPLP